jgi:hypothetical protein
MAATVNITSYHGYSAGSPTSNNNVDGGSLRFKVADNDTADANNPIPIPAAGTNQSWIKQLRFNAATTPSNTINNLKFYTDGSNGFGTGVALNVKTTATYTDPSAQGTTALTSTTSAFTYNSGAALSVTGSINNPSTGAFGDYIVMQMAVSSTAGPGTTPSETLTFSYDES